MPRQLPRDVSGGLRVDLVVQVECRPLRQYSPRGAHRVPIRSAAPMTAAVLDRKPHQIRHPGQQLDPHRTSPLGGVSRQTPTCCVFDPASAPTMRRTGGAQFRRTLRLPFRLAFAVWPARALQDLSREQPGEPARPGTTHGRWRAISLTFRATAYVCGRILLSR
jgi:hypothetical protein